MREPGESSLAPGVLSYSVNLGGGSDGAKAHSRGSCDRSRVLCKWAFDTLTWRPAGWRGPESSCKKQLKYFAAHLFSLIFLGRSGNSFYRSV